MEDCSLTFHLNFLVQKVFLLKQKGMSYKVLSLKWIDIIIQLIIKHFYHNKCIAGKKNVQLTEMEEKY